MCAKPCAGGSHGISKELGQEWYGQSTHNVGIRGLRRDWGALLRTVIFNPKAIASE